MEDKLDRLIDTLLREELGGEYPPDLTQRIMERAALRKRRRVLWIAVPAALAAAVLIAVAAWALLRDTYPQPRISGYHAASGEKLGRGSILNVGKETARIDLGGYCRVEVQPDSSVQIKGERRAEAVFLARGGVTCDVDSGVGAFEVQTDVGVVRVKGTQFLVRVIEEKGEDKMVSKRLWVRVAAGAVVVSGLWGSATLQAGEERVVPPKTVKPEVRVTETTAPKVLEPAPDVKAGKLVGILLTKGADFIVVKADGQKEGRKYTPMWVEGGLDKAMLAQFKHVYVGNLVEMEWKWIEHYRVVSIKMIVPEQKEGTVVGIIVAKGERAVDVKPDGAGPVERYAARWIGGREGGPDKDQLRILSELKPGDKVRINWKYEERKSILHIERLSAETVEAPK